MGTGRRLDEQLRAGQGWANLSNVPFRRYKRESHEGATSTPAIFHWPNGFEAKGALRRQVAHLIDLMPTFVEVSGAEYPIVRDGLDVQPMTGKSLVENFDSEETKARQLFWEHEGNRAYRSGSLKLVSSRNEPWELYEMGVDRTELNNLAAEKPELVEVLAAEWQSRADEMNVLTPEEFEELRKEVNRRK